MIRAYNNSEYIFGVGFVPCMFISCDSDDEREQAIKKSHLKYKGIYQKIMPYKSIDGKILYTFKIINVKQRYQQTRSENSREFTQEISSKGNNT